MIKNEVTRMWVNRVFAFLFGVLLIFLIMNFSVVRNFKNQNAELKKELYEANRLLTDAKALYENKNYGAAIETLNSLFEKHPGSPEMAEGKQLIAKIEAEQRSLDKKWEAAVVAIRAEWAKKMAAELRAQFEKDRETLETNMNDVLNTEWEKMKDEIRKEWEK
jgi:uncharacterized membrane-anchored protein YhcB (DUF1043 family)